MSFSRNYEPYASESPLAPVDEWPLEKRIVTGLQRRQMGLRLQPFQDEVLAPSL